jgi:hypothetical protein
VAFEEAVKLTPRSADAQNMPGQVMLQQGEVAGVIPQFRTVTQLKPTLPVRKARRKKLQKNLRKQRNWTHV